MVDVAANYTFLAAALWPYGLEGRDVQAVCGNQADLLADAKAVNFVPTLDCLSGLGIVGEELAEVLVAAPELLLRDADDVRSKIKILRHHRINLARDILWYPQVFRHRLQNMGSRLAFVDERQLGFLQNATLRKLLSCREEYFSEVLCRCLHEEYAVFKMQWEMTHGLGLGWSSSLQPPRSKQATTPDEGVKSAAGGRLNLRHARGRWRRVGNALEHQLGTTQRQQ